MAEQKIIEIVDNGDARYCLHPNFEVLGRMYDHEAETLQVVKPEVESESACIMVVSSNGIVIDNIVVGDEPILIRNNISQYPSVKIGFTFSRSDGYTKNSAVEKFLFLTAQKPVGFEPVESSWKDSINYLMAKGFTDARLDNNELIFYGVNGQEVTRITLGVVGGESGGSSVNVVDSLTSQSGTDALSARQGNVLYNMLVGSGEAINQANLNAQKQVLLGADGVLNGTTYSFTVQNPDDYIDYRTNLTKFLVDLNLPIVGELDTTKEVAITFGDTSYYVFNILKGMEHATIADLHQVDKYSNETGYRFIAEMTFFENADITGFAIIPTISMSDILSLDSDKMDNYMADGGLTQGQLAICKKVITNGYEEGALYRFDITYPSSYSWTQVSYSKSEIDNIVGSINTSLENILGV